MGAGVLLFALEHVLTGKPGPVRLGRHARGKDQLFWTQGHGFAIAQHVNGPMRAVIAGLLRHRAAPIIQLHHAGIHFQPIAQFVLGRKNRPVGGEGHIGQVVVPDRVVQAQRFVPVAPRIPGPCVFLDDDRRHTQLPQPRTKRDTALTATDNDNLGLGFIAQIRSLIGAGFGPGLATLFDLMRHALGPGRAPSFLVALEFLERGQQRPDFAVANADMAMAAPGFGFKVDERLFKPAAITGHFPRRNRKPMRFDRAQLCGQHGYNRRLPL